MDVHETTLPGVGKKYKCHLSESLNLIIIVHNTGKREVYLDDDPDKDNTKLFEMDERQAMIVGSILEGSTYPTDPPNDVQTQLDIESTIEWYTLKVGNSLIGRSLEEINADVDIDVQVIACKSEGDSTTTSLPDYVLSVEDLIIAVGSKGQHENFKKYLGV